MSHLRLVPPAAPSTLALRQVVHQPGPFGGRGIVQAVYNVNGGPAPYHSADVVFDDHITVAVPVNVILAYWTLGGTVTDAELTEAAAHARQCMLGAEMAEEIANAAFKAEVVALRANPAHAHLTQVAPGSYDHGTIGSKNIKADLRKAFPGIKFSVRKSTTGSVYVKWTGGPSEKVVRETVTGRYESKHFDGMTDSESRIRSAWIEVFGAGGYVSLSREETEAERQNRALQNAMRQPWGL